MYSSLVALPEQLSSQRKHQCEIRGSSTDLLLSVPLYVISVENLEYYLQLASSRVVLWLRIFREVLRNPARLLGLLVFLPV